MTGIAFALGAALSWGVSDFVGGLRSRSAHFIWVTLMSQLVLTVGVSTWALVFRPGTPTPAALGWGALAAVGHVAGTLFLMRGLAAGAMHVAGPISAVVAGAIPVIVGVATGERPSLASWIGIALALPAVWLVTAGAAAPDDPEVAGGPGVPAGVPGRLRGPAGALDGVLAGAGFALFFVAIAQPDASSGGWPLVTLEFTALVMLVALAFIRRPAGRLWDARGAWLAGALGVAATILYYLATHSGMLSIVAVVSSLYPAFTVILAVAVLHERPTLRQIGGLALAAASVALIAVGGT